MPAWQRGLDALLAGTAVAGELRARLATEKERKAALTAELAAIRAPRGQHGPAVAAPLLAALRASARHIRAVLGQDIPRTAPDPPPAAGRAPRLQRVQRGGAGRLPLRRARPPRRAHAPAVSASGYGTPCRLPQRRLQPPSAQDPS